LTLQQRVEQRFWMDDQGFYGIAIDGHGALARVCASNAGHLLFTGLCDAPRAARMTQRFLSGAFSSGWGIRTLAGDQVHFNPMSYHNGSIWPHDTALCAAGMARYGERDGVVALTQQIFEAGAAFDMRLPELYCGFTRRNGEKPIAYPVACLPQAWAAGSIFLLIQAWLGIEIDGWKGQIRLDRPILPETVNRLTVNGLTIGPNRVDLRVERRNGAIFATLGGTDAERVSLIASHSAASETRPS
jgi:glycogen debranching enzyme